MVLYKQLVKCLLLISAMCIIVQANLILADEQDELLERDASVLQNYGIALTLDGLIVGLQHKEMVARGIACNALGIIGDLNAIAPLAKVAREDNQAVAVSAIKAIDQILGREISALAEDLWKRTNYKSEKFAIAEILSTVGDTRYFKEILQVLRDPNNVLFVRAVRRVPDCARYNLYENGESVNWIQELSSLLKDYSIQNQKRIEIFRALDKIGSKESLEIIKSRLDLEQDEDVRSTIKYIVKKYK